MPKDPNFMSLIIPTCSGEDGEAMGHSGHFQSWTESEANITAKVAWTVETRRLLNPNEYLRKTLLNITNASVHETTPKAIVFLTLSSISITSKQQNVKKSIQQI